MNACLLPCLTTRLNACLAACLKACLKACWHVYLKPPSLVDRALHTYLNVATRLLAP